MLDAEVGKTTGGHDACPSGMRHRARGLWTPLSRTFSGLVLVLGSEGPQGPSLCGGGGGRLFPPRPGPFSHARLQVFFGLRGQRPYGIVRWQCER